MRNEKKIIYSGYFLNGQKQEYIIARLFDTGELHCEKRPVDPQGLRLEYIKQELRFTNIQAQEDYALAPLLVKIANHLNKLGEAFERRAMLRPQLGYALSQLCPQLPTFDVKLFTIDQNEEVDVVTEVYISKEGQMTTNRKLSRKKDKTAEMVMSLKERGYQLDAGGRITQALKCLHDYQHSMQNTLAESENQFCDMPDIDHHYSFKRF